MLTALLERYDAEMRRDPPLTQGVEATRVGGRVRLSGPYNCIVYSDLSEADAEAQVVAEVAHLRATGGALEWKVHGHDRPGDLPLILERHGFVPEPQETLLVRALDEGLLGRPADLGLSIRTVTTAEDVSDFLRAVEAAFGHPFGHDAALLLADIRAGLASAHVAFVDGVPVAAGRLEMPPGRSFAGLYTGGVAPACRGRGLYRALVQSRAREAAARGYEYLITEALETSRPILERLGFMPLTTVQGWVLEVAVGEA
ncbi:MAG: GNAT family N-acetyltransferase [Phenylobacterium sp.]|uniref:GNAT family N-acetyltransferase n=1 Tax=Phenylobacterium sp. TaxID=1871053 RepID=UPI0027366548|nr:GNAT family N-acetyltransferase [Phenylobacterium sp.]MDP1640689.1 GNAT family N-acetyltransferase [Phenylobacterium sp.]MDP3117782.1 GNAT family N-acetyltransferase [Phenylobacterium sp.]